MQDERVLCFVTADCQFYTSLYLKSHVMKRRHLKQQKYRKCNKCKKRIMWKMHSRNVFLVVEMLAVYLLHEYLELRRLAPNVSLTVRGFPCYKYYIFFPQESRKVIDKTLKAPFFCSLKSVHLDCKFLCAT